MLRMAMQYRLIFSLIGRYPGRNSGCRAVSLVVQDLGAECSVAGYCTGASCFLK